MKKFFLFLSLILMLGVFSVPVFAQSFLHGFKFGLYDKPYTMSDVTIGARDTTVNANTSSMASGACYGPVFQAVSGSNWLADFIKVCGLGAAPVNGSTITDGGSVYPLAGIELFDVLGLHGLVGSNLNYGGFWYGFGVSFGGAAHTLGLQ